MSLLRIFLDVFCLDGVECSTSVDMCFWILSISQAKKVVSRSVRSSFFISFDIVRSVMSFLEIILMLCSLQFLPVQLWVVFCEFQCSCVVDSTGRWAMFCLIWASLLLLFLAIYSQLISSSYAGRRSLLFWRYFSLVEYVLERLFSCFVIEFIVKSSLLFCLFLFLLLDIFLGILNKEKLLFSFHFFANIAAIECSIPFFLIFLRLKLHINIEVLFIFENGKHNENMRLGVIVNILYFMQFESFKRRSLFCRTVDS